MDMGPSIEAWATYRDHTTKAILPHPSNHQQPIALSKGWRLIRLYFTLVGILTALIFLGCGEGINSYCKFMREMLMQCP